LTFPTLDSDSPKYSRTAYAVVALTLLAPTLGGSVELWAQAVVMAGTGLFLLCAPPQKSLGLLPNLAFAGLLLIAFTGFVPAHWFPAELWRIEFVRLGGDLPATRSPQPWLTLQWSCVLLLGVAWAYWLFAFSWSRRLRERACAAYAIGILCLAATLIISFIGQRRVPFWPDAPGFGFFPNRNQTSNVLGLGGVMIYGLGLQSLLENRRFWWLWPISLSILCWALILNYSRAGIILFFSGAVALHIYWWATAKDRRRLIVTFAGLFLLVALFFINGGATLARFGRETTTFFEANLRWPIYRDACALLLKSPILGVGLGNFESIFAFNRFASALPNEAVHPESDWLWLTIELGWFAPVLILLLFIWWLKRCSPFEPGTARLLRVGAMICGCAFAIHGIFDVSGHRIGTLCPVLFLGSLALHSDDERKSAKLVGYLFRALGFLFVLIGAWWIATIFGARTPPTTATVNQLKACMSKAIDQQEYAVVPSLAERGLRIAPLDWLFYYKRGVAEAALSTSHLAALGDFKMARYLNRLWPDLCLQEGEVWLSIGEEDLVFDAWSEALKRVGKDASGYYSRMLGEVKDEPTLIDRMRDLIQGDNARLIVFLRNVPPFEFQLELALALSKNPELHSFSGAELAELFTAWYEKGDKIDLIRMLEAHSEWKKIAWRELARAYADHEDFRRAYETGCQFTSRPELPHPPTEEVLEKLKARFLLNRSDMDVGLSLYFAQTREGQTDSALETLRELTALPESPKYLFYLEAKLWGEKREWKKAWEALARFRSA
jgi:hypothetical protein